MTPDWILALCGLLVGGVIGLTGMGGGAFLTPMLVLGFGMDPIKAISSDLLASLFVKPVGGIVHGKRGGVCWPLVRWLVMGSMPAAFVSVWLLKMWVADPELLHDVGMWLVGGALSIAVIGMSLKQWLPRFQHPASAESPLVVRPIATLCVGVVGGIMVGLTSVGAGSLMGALLLLLYPRMSMKTLVGTDLVQAVPLVAAATLGHLIWGEVQIPVAMSLAIGAVPGVWLGSRWSAKAPDGILRPLLAGLLLATSLKLFGFSIAWLLVSALVYWVIWSVMSWRRRQHKVASAHSMDGAGI